MKTKIVDPFRNLFSNFMHRSVNVSSIRMYRTKKNRSYWKFSIFFTTLNTKLASFFVDPFRSGSFFESFNLIFNSNNNHHSWMCISTWNIYSIWWNTNREVERNHYWFNFHCSLFSICQIFHIFQFHVVSLTVVLLIQHLSFRWVCDMTNEVFYLTLLPTPNYSNEILYPKQTVFFDQVHRLISLGLTTSPSITSSLHIWTFGLWIVNIKF